MEDWLGAISPGADAIRELISSLELCHHKARRWVHNIILAIGTGETAKGLGTRDPGCLHDAEKVWQTVCDALSSWCAGQAPSSFEDTVGTVPIAGLVTRISARTPLKEWQVQRVIERARSLIHWPPPTDDPAAGFTWLLFSEGTDGSSFRDRCPQRFAEHEELWRATICTIIRDTHDGREAPISLGLAIDMLWPCHWDFLANLQIVLGAIGGDLDPHRPFAACGRNIGRLPDRDHFQRISRTLQSYAGATPAIGDPALQVLELLGPPTPEKQWLAASLDKTIRLQLDPPMAMRRVFDLAGPPWIHDRQPGPL
jgi:hypothetical protein